MQNILLWRDNKFIQASPADSTLLWRIQVSKLCAFGLVGFLVVVLVCPRNWFQQLGFGYLTMQLVLDLVWHLVLSLLDQKLSDTWDWNHIMLVGEVSSPSFLQLWIRNIFWFWNIIKWTRRLLSKSNACPNWFRLNVISAVYSTFVHRVPRTQTHSCDDT